MAGLILHILNISSKKKNQAELASYFKLYTHKNENKQTPADLSSYLHTTTPQKQSSIKTYQPLMIKLPK